MRAYIIIPAAAAAGDDCVVVSSAVQVAPRRGVRPHSQVRKHSLPDAKSSCNPSVSLAADRFAIHGRSPIAFKSNY